MKKLPYATHLGIEVISDKDNKSHLKLNIKPHHLNRHDVLAGGLLYSIADVGMGLALYPTLADGQICATVEIKMSYFNSANEGKIDCYTKTIKRGKRLAFFESEVYHKKTLLAKASGSYIILTPKKI